MTSFTSFLLALALAVSIGFPAFSCVPSLSLEPLEKQAAPLSLPQDLKNKPTFVAFGFNYKSQPVIEKALVELQAFQGLSLVEIPVVAESYKGLKDQIAPFMRLQMKEKSLLPVVYPLYTDKKDLKTQLGLSKKQDVAFYLCDPAGKQVWKSTESFTSEDKATLTKLLQSLQPSS